MNANNEIELTLIQRLGLVAQLEDLKKELDEIKQIESEKIRFQKLYEFFTKPHTVSVTLHALELHEDAVYDDFNDLANDTLELMHELNMN